MSKYDDLVRKLKEIFQIDRPELDFGIYRILNARVGEINDYLENGLKAKVAESLAASGAGNLEALQKELKDKETQYRADGMDPDTVPKVKELRQKIVDLGSGGAEHENAVFTHLLTFFSRYYDKGDFISQRRYKGDTYAIPYAGEEVVLHWANKDQFYTKSGENFSNYGFKLDDGRTVRFHLVTANTAKDNRKETDRERNFVLIESHTRTLIDENGEEYDQELLPVEEVGNELIIRFEYKAMPKGSKQEVLMAKAAESILSNPVVKTRWLDLSKREPTEKNPQRTLLEKCLTSYATKNLSDYFIHKDLGSFLRRELDFYIKSEVMNLDDIQNAEAFSDIESSLRMIRTLRAISLDVIGFLEQLENFQKRLWLKKKFVVETNYCISIDKISESLYEKILSCEKQVSEWADLYGLNGEGNSFEDYKNSLNPDFLKKNPHLIVDTSNFDDQVKGDILMGIDDLDGCTNGWLIHGDNYQGLQLTRERFQGKVKSVYLDPPYNTAVSAIPYKNNYCHSSWATMMQDRLSLVHALMSNTSACYVSIDKNERDSLVGAMDLVFGRENKVEELIWVQNTNDGRAKTFSTNHEYVEVYSKDLRAVEEDFSMFREPKPGFEEVMHLVLELNVDYPKSEIIQEKLRDLYKSHSAEYKAQVEAEDLDWETEKRNDPWKGIYQYKFAEYRDEAGRYVQDDKAKDCNAKIWIYRESDWTIMESDQKQSTTTKDPSHPNYRYYQPDHPITGRPCAMPSRGWKGTRYIDPEHPDRNSWESLLADHRIAFGEVESKVPQQKRFLHEVDSNVSKSIIVDYSDGEKETTNIFGRKGVFLAPKHTGFVSRFVLQSTGKDSFVLDIFGGSGSTAGAVIECNRVDGLNRKFILFESNAYIDTTILPRIKKTSYASKWRSGKPISKDGVSLCLKFQRIESYEDTLNNLNLNRTQAQQTIFDSMPMQAREDYLLRYMLDFESRGSLLSVDQFKKPFDCKLKVAVDSAGAYEERTIDLVETFNYLIGLQIKHVDLQAKRGFVSVTGVLPSGEKTLVLWRDVEKLDYEELNRLCDKLAINPSDSEFDVVYVNGDHNIPAVFTSTEAEGGITKTLKIRQIEPEFMSRMFNTEA